MNTSMRLRSTLALLAAGAIVSVAAVSAQASGGPLYGGPQVVDDVGSGDVVLRRDGTKATTFVADVSPAPVLHRDGTKATPFVADVGPQPTASADTFDWSDAAIGAAVGLLIAAVAVAGSAAIRGRPTHAAGSTPASQGA